MRILGSILPVVIVVFGAVNASAQPLPDQNVLGFFFSDTEFTEETTNWVNTFTPFSGYIVLLDGTVDSIGGYEVGLEFDTELLFLLSLIGPPGMINVGDIVNLICAFPTPIPVDPFGVVLSELVMLYLDDAPVCIMLVPVNTPSIPGYPGILDGADYATVLPCNVFNAPDCTATINAPVAAERRSLTHIKALFD